MKCAHCGSLLDPNSQFCSRCGRPAGERAKVTHREGDEKAVHTVRLDEVLSGRYTLKARLGEGGMGAVYLAHDRELDREVAVKLLAATLVNDTEVVERFEREARLTAKLDHPNIVPVYDVGRHEGRPYIVMKKLEGSTLAGLLREKGGLTAEETLKLLKQLAAGLDFIHNKQFIHRDIKAGNIFVGPEGHATLLDFGILRPSHASEGLTKAGVVMGTPHYMAPEQAMGAKDVDHRADLYALAVVVFEALTGTLPFEADSELRLIQMQAHAPPPDLLERAPWIPRPVAEVVKRALAKRPEDRFSSASEMVKALEAAYAQAKTQALPQAGGGPQAPVAYKGPIEAPGTAPSWRRKSGDELPIVPSAPVPGSAPRPPMPVAEPIVTGANPLPPPARGLQLAAVAVLLLGAAIVVMAKEPWKTNPLALVPDAGRPVVVAISDVPDASLAADDDAGSVAVMVMVTPDAGALAVADVPDAGRRVPFSMKRGVVNVISLHDGEMFWGQVFLDGIDRGRTPLSIELAPGRYQLRITRHGFKTQERQIFIASGRSIVERFDLAP